MPIEQTGHLKYWASKKTIIGLALPSGWIRLCHVLFGSDGSIYVDWPDFRITDGILSVVRLDDHGRTSNTVEFLGQGKVTSHLVKFSHHPDGRVHFSQTKKVRPQVFRNARFPLNGPIGRLLEVSANRPVDGFQVRREARRGKPHLLFRYRTDPASVVLVFEWRRKSDVSSWNQGAPLGPKAQLFHKASKSECPAFFVGQPTGSPFHDHVLVVTCRTAGPFQGVDGPAIVLRGGADSDEVARSGDRPPPSEFLAALYPIRDRSALQALIGTVDLVVPTAV